MKRNTVKAEAAAMLERVLENARLRNGREATGSELLRWARVHRTVARGLLAVVAKRDRAAPPRDIARLQRVLDHARLRDGRDATDLELLRWARVYRKVARGLLAVVEEVDEPVEHMERDRWQAKSA